ncbi:hypothetical protein KEM52_006323, partial [Ascosphaera acerosa]
MANDPREAFQRLQMNLQRTQRGGFPGGGPRAFGGAGALVLLGLGGYALSQSLFNVDGGHRAIKYTR